MSSLPTCLCADVGRSFGVLWCAVLWCAVLCCGVLRCAVLCCGVLWCAMLCCAVLCCAVLWCAVLWCAVVWCAVLCCGVLCRAVLCTGALDRISAAVFLTDMGRLDRVVRALSSILLGGHGEQQPVQQISSPPPAPSCSALSTARSASQGCALQSVLACFPSPAHWSGGEGHCANRSCANRSVLADGGGHCANRSVLADTGLRAMSASLSYDEAQCGVERLELLRASAPSAADGGDAGRR